MNKRAALVLSSLGLAGAALGGLTMFAAVSGLEFARRVQIRLEVGHWPIPDEHFPQGTAFVTLFCFGVGGLLGAILAPLLVRTLLASVPLGKVALGLPLGAFLGGLLGALLLGHLPFHLGLMLEIATPLVAAALGTLGAAFVLRRR
ncbi:MAG: hypothetical protein U1E65_26900 [Myxococcota bacterium]